MYYGCGMIIYSLLLGVDAHFVDSLYPEIFSKIQKGLVDISQRTNQLMNIEVAMIRDDMIFDNVNGS